MVTRQMIKKKICLCCVLTVTVLHQTLGNQNFNGVVVQWQETSDLKSLQCGFESHLRYQFMKSIEDVKLEIIQGNLAKIEEMYKILTMLESYLQRPSLDGRTDRQEMRKKLKESLDSL